MNGTLFLQPHLKVGRSYRNFLQVAPGIGLLMTAPAAVFANLASGRNTAAAAHLRTASREPEAVGLSEGTHDLGETRQQVLRCQRLSFIKSSGSIVFTFIDCGKTVVAWRHGMCGCNVH